MSKVLNNDMCYCSDVESDTKDSSQSAHGERGGNAELCSVRPRRARSGGTRGGSTRRRRAGRCGGGGSALGWLGDRAERDGRSAWDRDLDGTGGAVDVRAGKGRAQRAGGDCDTFTGEGLVVTRTRLEDGVTGI